MRGTGWTFAVLVLCSIPLAIGIALGESWPTYVTYAAWGIFAAAAVVRSILPRHRRQNRNAAVSAGDVYNELYLGRPRTTVTFGSSEKIVAEEQLVRRDELADGVVRLSDEQRPSTEGTDHG